LSRQEVPGRRLNVNTTRRGLLVGAIPFAAFTVLSHSALAQTDDALPDDLPDLERLAERFAPAYPQFPIALEIMAQTGATIEVGQGPDGMRRIVPVIGGVFRGSGSLSGTVLPGADRQRVRPDGVRELDAIYELAADDGTVLMVHNSVLVDDRQPPAGWPRYARSVVRITAPDGPHAWLNRRILIGTLDSLRPAQPYVFLRFYILQ
jgi:hypothetical protein